MGYEAIFLRQSTYSYLDVYHNCPGTCKYQNPLYTLNIFNLLYVNYKEFLIQINVSCSVSLLFYRFNKYKNLFLVFKKKNTILTIIESYLVYTTNL